MVDFVSAFWSWFIAIPTVVGLAGVAWMTLRSTEKTARGGQAETMGHVWDEDLEELDNPLPAWWRNLLYLTIALAIGYLAIYPGLGAFSGLLGWTQESQYQREIQDAEQRFGPLFDRHAARPVAALAKDPEALKTGARLFSNYCATCHGSDARGASGFPDLTDDDWLWGGDPEAIEASILDGRSGVMPPWKQALGEQGVAQLTQYVLALSGRPADSALAAAGEQKFKVFCAACHLSDGRGNPQLGAPDLRDEVWLYGARESAIAQSIAEGRQGRMPAHRAFLGESKAHLLAAYVYSLSLRR